MPTSSQFKKNTFVAFLRGINVGGNTLVRMTDLKTCFENAGLQDVQTYINSGNVIFRTNSHNSREIEDKIERAILHSFAIPISVVVRTFSVMQKLFEQIPVSWHTNLEQKCNVIFLKSEIDNEHILD